MSYKCGSCGITCPSRQKRLMVIIQRLIPPVKDCGGLTLHKGRAEIAREISVCASCHRRVAEGAPISSIGKKQGTLHKAAIKTAMPTAPEINDNLWAE